MNAQLILKSGKIFISALAITALAACTKGELSGPSDNQGNEVLNVPKMDQLYILRNLGSNGNFLIRNSGGCVYGYTYVGDVFISNFDATGTGILSHDGECNYPAPSSPIYLKKGTAPGLLGPVYYIVPSQSHSGTHTALKIQVRNVSGASSADYNSQFTYNPTSHTWSWRSDASTLFYFSVIPNYALYMCPGRD